MSLLKVKHQRKGSMRQVCLYGGQIKVVHQFDKRLLNRFRYHVKGAVYHPSQTRHECGFFLLPLTQENALQVLKFGIENDYRFSEEVGLKFAEFTKPQPVQAELHIV